MRPSLLPGSAAVLPLLAPLTFAAPQDVQPPGASPAPQRLDERFEHPDGLAVSLWAESPQLYNPTAMDVDAAGRVWVTEAVNYRRWGGRNPGRAHPAGDRVVVLEDTDGDGRADRSTVFAQDEDLVAPLGICLLPGGRVLVSCSPTLWLYTDRDGDLVADEREALLTGWGGLDHDHGLHSAVPAHDGRLLLVAGNAGPHVVTDRDGWTLRSGSFYRGGTPHSRGNTPGLVSDDGRVHVGGLVLAMDPDGGGLEVLAHNFRNPYEAAADPFGRLFTADNDDDGNRAVRTAYVFEGGDYGYASTGGSRSWQADRRPGQSTQEAHWRQGNPGVFPMGTINGAGGPTGVCVYEAGLPSDPMYAFNGAVLNCDAGAGVVYAHLPRRKRAGVELVPSRLLGRGADGDGDEPGAKGAWFRPSDVAVAPDGSILVADWYDPAVGGHGAGDRAAYGRILRLWPEDAAADPARAPLVLPPYEPDPAEAAEPDPFGPDLDGLVSPAPAERFAAFTRLAAAGEAAYDALHGLAGHPNPYQAARPLYLLARLQPRGVAFVEQLFHQPVPELRAAAWRALLAAGTWQPEHLLAVVRDRDPFVRTTAAPLLRDLGWTAAQVPLVELAQRYEGQDPAYLAALGVAAEGKRAELYAALRERNGGPAADPAVFAEFAWILHPEACVPDLVPRLMDAGRPREERARLLDALAFVPSRAAAEAMLNLSLAGPRDLRGAAAFWVRLRATNLWRTYDLAGEPEPQSLDAAVRVFQSPRLTGGSVALDVDGLADASHLWLVVTDAGDGHGCDWASFGDLAFEGAFGRQSLAEQGWVSAKTGWGQVNAGQNCGGGPLVIDGVTYTDGLGVHAAAQVLFTVPEGAERLVGVAGPDLGGTSQGCGSTMVFEVHLVPKGGEDPLGALRATVRDLDAGLDARLAAARRLAEDPRGGFALVDLAQRDELPAVLRTAVAPALHRSPDFALRALASGLFPREGQAGPPLPPLAELAALPGDRRAGQALFASERAACMTCHRVRGVGGDVGPELTGIGAKYGGPELLDAILNPSAAIAHGYETWLVEDVDGRLFAGRILADGEDLLLQDTAGRRHVIPADQVAARTLQRTSSMPDNAALGLAPQELADLLAFLRYEPPAEPRFGEPLALFDGSSGLQGWVPFLPDPSADPAATWSVRDGVLRCEGRPAGYLRTEGVFGSFELTLQWRFDPEAGPGNSGVLLRVQAPDKVWPKSIEAQLMHRNAGDIWNIDAVAMRTDPSRLSGRRTRKAFPTNERPLGQWNDHRIRLVHGELELWVNGLLQNTATWCEETPGHLALQSEGAVIEFRDVQLRPLLED